MKAIFISYSRAFNEEIVELLDFFQQRGFTSWDSVIGRGSKDGDPHYDNHAWPESNHAILTFVEDDGKAEKILRALRRKDASSPGLGLRAFSWSVDTPAED